MSGDYVPTAEWWIICQYAKCCGTSNRKRSTSYFLSYMYNKACRTANKISLYTRHCCTCTPNTAVLLIRIWRFFLQGRKSGGFYFKTRKTYGNKKVAGCQSAKPKHLLGKKMPQTQNVQYFWFLLNRPYEWLSCVPQNEADINFVYLILIHIL